MNNRMALSLAAPGIVWATMVACVPDRAATAAGSPSCEREVVSSVVSPDDTWVALTHAAICSDGRLVTVAFQVVQLVRKDKIDAIPLGNRVAEPSYEDDVFSMDDFGDPLERPVTQWVDPQKLRITVPNISSIGLQRSSYMGIEIAIQHHPDNPAARESWKRERGLQSK
jgi:hypothetical protein